jgi:hypothetical protein
MDSLSELKFSPSSESSSVVLASVGVRSVRKEILNPKYLCRYPCILNLGNSFQEFLVRLMECGDPVGLLGAMLMDLSDQLLIFASSPRRFYHIQQWGLKKKMR